MSAFRIVRWILTTALASSLLFSGNPALAESLELDHSDMPQGIAGPTAEPALGSEIVVSALDNQQLRPDVAYNTQHREYLVVWQNNWPGNRDIYGQRISEDGKLRSWFAISAGPNDRAQPSVAYDPVHDRYLVTWVHDISGNGSNWDVRGRIIPWDGPSPALAEFVICDWPTTQWNPEVAHGLSQGEFMVVWWTAHTAVPAYVSGRRIDAAGGAPADSPFAIAYHPSAGASSPRCRLQPEPQRISGHLSRWAGYFRHAPAGQRQHPGRRRVRHRRLAGCRDRRSRSRPAIRPINTWWPGSHCSQEPSTTSTPASSTAMVCPNRPSDGSFSVHQQSPAITCSHNGRLYAVTWQQQYSNITGPYGIWGRMISSEKQLGDAFA